MKIIFETDRIIVKKLFGKKEIFPKDVQKVACLVNGTRITLKKDKQEIVTKQMFLIGLDSKLGRFICDNNIDYEDETEKDTLGYSKSKCEEMAERSLAIIQEHGSKLIKDYLGEEYDFCMEEQNENFAINITYWVTKNGEKVELPGYEKCENGMNAIGDMLLSYLIGWDSVTASGTYEVVTELLDDQKCREYLESEIEFFKMRQDYSK